MEEPLQNGGAPSMTSNAFSTLHKVPPECSTRNDDAGRPLRNLLQTGGASIWRTLVFQMEEPLQNGGAPSMTSNVFGTLHKVPPAC